MITLTNSTVHGAPGMTLAELDAETIGLCVRLGGGLATPERAADFLRHAYRDVLRSAGSVDLDNSKISGGVRVAA